MLHYHIRWSSGKLDWERFVTYEDAEATAKDLIRLNESFKIEEAHGNCPRCLIDRAVLTESSREVTTPTRTTISSVKNKITSPEIAKAWNRGSDADKFTMLSGYPEIDKVRVPCRWYELPPRAQAFILNKLA